MRREVVKLFQDLCPFTWDLKESSRSGQRWGLAGVMDIQANGRACVKIQGRRGIKRGTPMEHHSKKETGHKLESADQAGPCKLCEEFWIISGVRERHQSGESHGFCSFKKDHSV